MSRHFSLRELTTVRLLQPDDMEQVQTLLLKNFTDAPASVAIDQLSRKDPSLTVLVADCGGQIVGIAVLRERPWRFWTTAEFLGVRPDFHDRGVGRGLLDTAILHIRRPCLRVLCSLTNEKVLTLFRTARFQDMGLRKRHFTNGDDAIILMKWCGMRSFRNPG